MNNSVCGVGDTDFCALCVTEPFSATGRTNGPVARGYSLANIRARLRRESLYGVGESLGGDGFCHGRGVNMTELGWGGYKEALPMIFPWHHDDSNLPKLDTLKKCCLYWSCS
jgi:hypothetical protein